MQTSPQELVSSIVNFGPVAGTPLIPKEILFWYASTSLLVVLFIFWLFINKRKSKRQLLRFFASFLLAQIAFFFLAAVSFAWYLLPQPKVARSNTGEKVEIFFDRPVSRGILEKNISPNVPGVWVFENPVYSTHLFRKVVFYPSVAPFAPDTTYTVTLSNIKNVLKTSTGQKFNFSFTTTSRPAEGEKQEKETLAEINKKTVRLEVPVYLQQHALSCEAAALRMALAFYGKEVSEDKLLAKIGVDNTPHQGNIWGNPHNAFVGNVNGTQMHDGYGVYWGPIARVAREYRNAQEFENGSITTITKAIQEKHPVEIWVYSSGGWPTSWTTPDGKNIYAVRDEHAVTIVGFVGSADNPTYIIVNDPLVGQVYWTREIFDSKWKIFGNSGVVIY